MPRLNKGQNDLETKNSLLAQEWHPTKNATLLPSDVAQFSSKKVWWLGKCDHEWDALVSKRSNGQSCPYCANIRVLAGFNDLFSKYPEISKEWHFSKNKPLTPNVISPRSNKKVWWLGGCGHEWQSTPDKRTSRRQGCPFCSSVQILKGFNDLATLYPHLVSEWSSKNSISPDNSTIRNTSLLKWMGKCGHEWESTLGNRKSGAGCPVCVNKTIHAEINSFAIVNKKLLTEWDFSKNLHISPYEVSSGSNKKVWWLGICGHSWIASIAHRVSGKGCAVCIGKQLQIGVNDLSTLHPTLASEFHPVKNGSLTASDVIANSHTKFWWIGSCLHEWKADPHHRMTGVGCPFCAGKQILSGYNDLASLFPHVSAEWHPSKNGSLTPHIVTATSGKKVWWKCTQNHEYQSIIASRTKRGTGCPECIQASTSKIQQAFHKVLAVKIPDLQCDTRISVPFKSRKSISVDMISIASNVVIEYDGEYYHSGKRSGKGLQYHLDHDSAKTQALLDAGYRVVRIRENGLQHLNMTHERLMQISYKNGDLMNSVVDEILKWG